jgi:hypothetical protein
MPFDECRQPNIVRIQKRNNLSAGFFDSTIPGCRWPGVFLGYYSDSLSELGQFLKGGVRRTIVYDDNFDVFVGLPDNAFYRFTNYVCPVIGCNDRAYQGLLCHKKAPLITI